MSDDLDRITEHADLLINAQIKTVKNQLVGRRPLQPRGKCHFCLGIVNSEQLYCDDYCASEHADEQAAKIRNVGRYRC